MLSAYSAETIAYTGDGFILHRECAIREYSTVRIERADAGLDNGLNPMIRYSVDTWAGEEAWDIARDKLDDFEDDHPRLAILLGVNRERRCEPRPGSYCGFFRTEGRNRDRMLGRIVQKLGDSVGPTCDRCTGFILEPPLEYRIP